MIPGLDRFGLADRISRKLDRLLDRLRGNAFEDAALSPATTRRRSPSRAPGSPKSLSTSADDRGGRAEVGSPLL